MQKNTHNTLADKGLRTWVAYWPCGLCALVLFAACNGRARDLVPTDDLRTALHLTNVGPVPYPDDNPAVPARIDLGRLLFYDPVLSGERDVACGTCHHPDFAFTDGRQFGAGVSGTGLGPARRLSHSVASGETMRELPRNVPTVLNAALAFGPDGRPSSMAPLLWDGRVEGLERLVPRPLAVREEMRGDVYRGPEMEVARATLDSILERLRDIPAYVDLFEQAFPEEQATPAARAALIDSSTYSRAVAAFVRELVSLRSPYDRYVDGDDEALSEQAKRGLILFYGKAACGTCHAGPMFSDFKLRRVGVPQVGVGGTMLPGEDTGLTEDTRDPEDRFLFRTPSLRNVALTGPYMHDGVFDTLDEVVRFFNRGAYPRHEQVGEDLIDPGIRPLDLTDREIDDIVAFLGTLSDPGTEIDPTLLSIPDAVPSGLPPVFGVRTGTGATVR